MLQVAHPLARISGAIVAPVRAVAVGSVSEPFAFVHATIDTI
jgi:hypothetical protein